MAKKKRKRGKHVPLRTCIGCRRVESKRSMIRVVRQPEAVQVDPTGKLAGRGAYIHPWRSCWERALGGALKHALKTDLTEEDIVRLTSFMETLPAEPVGEAEIGDGAP